ncbi:hypothetical protein [Halorubrum ezzemoulense]|uniref:hypothetical protein n=1 Tax=Halorubrum ezzemoulense TaxID=337243 RepID=UPI0011818DD8|nr:hypothetical protein [Halorubrum ezzemoulense]
MEATVRYNNFSDNEVLDTSAESFDSLLVSGKMAAYATKAVPARLQNLNDEYGIEYYIEPTLPDFRVGNDFRDNDRIKQWHFDYIDKLHPAVERILAEQGNLDASEISPEERENIVRSDVKFQERIVPDSLEKNSTKYQDISPSEYQPKAIIPWHHRIRSSDDIDVNAHIIETALDQTSLTLKPCIQTTKEYITNLSNQQQVLDMLVEAGVDQCFIWIEGLDKRDTGQDTYEKVTRFVKAVSDAGIDPHFYYADYFGTMLKHAGMSGVTYGTMWGEEAEETVEGTSGGGALSRYYVPQMKDFLKIPAAVELQQLADAPMCDCRVCSDQFDSWTDLTEREEDDDENIQTPIKKHHLIKRYEQIGEVENQDLDETIEACRGEFNEYVSPFNSANQISPSKKIDYLPIWVNAIDNQLN